MPPRETHRRAVSADVTGVVGVVTRGRREDDDVRSRTLVYAADEVARPTDGTLDAMAGFTGTLGIEALLDIPADKMLGVLNLEVVGQARIHRARSPRT